MIDVNKRHILLLAIFAFALAYRVFVLLNQTYPPGADIGFHASVINSITKSGNTNFLWNYFQMGGEIELEFPGFHIFTSAIILFTGLPIYVASALVASTFSSLIVLAVFLVTRVAWNETAAFIVAVLVLFSRWDLDVLCWGGYPNIIALSMIPIAFYMLIKKDKLSKTSYITATSLVVASLFLSHSLSAVIFMGITIIAMVFVLVFPKAFQTPRISILYWIIPILIGLILVSPFLATAIPIYLNQSTILNGTPAVAQALLEYRSFPFVVVLALFTGIATFFAFSKYVKGRFFFFPLFLVIIWLLVPLLFTQGYLVGLFVDSYRFLFFFIYSVLILFAMIIDYASSYLSGAISSLGFWAKSKLSPKHLRFGLKGIFALVMVLFLLLLPLNYPLFNLPYEGVKVQRFYQVMDNEGYKAIEWIKANTSEGSVFASDMGYGWWLAGFGQRPTITDVDLQAISLANEVSISKNVSYLLDTNYVIDNGYLQVREDGGYLSRHNPLITADVDWTTENVPFIQFSGDKITLQYQSGGTSQSINLSQIPVTNMQLVGAETHSPSIVINKSNGELTCSEIITLTAGQKYVNITYILQSNYGNLSLNSLNFSINSEGVLNQSDNTLKLLDINNKASTQLIFENVTPEVSLTDSQNPCTISLAYKLTGKSTIVQILAGITELSTEEINNYANQSTSEIIQKALIPSTSLPIITFDYQKAMQDYNVSYVANIDFTVNPKFLSDPRFHLVFGNAEVAIFKVERNATG
jgi:hypothetical protein